MKTRQATVRTCTVVVELAASVRMFRRQDWFEGEALAGEVEMDVVDVYVEQCWQSDQILLALDEEVGGQCVLVHRSAKKDCTVRCEVTIPRSVLPSVHVRTGVANVASMLNALSMTCNTAEPRLHLRGSYMEMVSINAYPIPRITIRVQQR